jgi:hypothetical protein
MLPSASSGLGAPVADIEDFIAPRRPADCTSPRPADTAGDGSVLVRRSAPWVAISVAATAGAVLAALVVALTAGVAEAVSAPAGLAGFAEMYVATYLTAAGGDDDALSPFLAGEENLSAMTPHERFVTGAAAVAARPLDDRYWAVTVVARVLDRTASGYADGGRHTFEVAVADTGGGFAATGLPVPVPKHVAAAAPGAFVDLGGGVDADLDALARGFAAAYLAGDGALSRHVTAGSGLAPVDPAYPSVEVGEVRAGEVAGVAYMAIGATITDAAGHRLATTLTAAVAVESGTWRVARLLPGPPQAPTGSVPR